MMKEIKAAKKCPLMDIACMYVEKEKRV